ncbi:hypothetical protein COT42_01565 [Candidatus Saganbacteria bacterium CG08_land_8_20_14_0_20_45_16]|uniref:Methyltransferase domain-containing protein n=1 Tax=Candidatus Saganbacteria bacterium CG08_land_8_20_14_0_20_45_16 TaxID=2014293 RepID=A0A2H0Y147_UNCSA|nr:MAG: hypothetical protein COT42_01565 [Candidatus Saganbacteria bacterium CG08_land_8_20_14_0_20_45_16]
MSKGFGLFFNAPHASDIICRPVGLDRYLKSKKLPPRPIVVDAGTGSGQNITYLLEEIKASVLALDIDTRLTAHHPDIRQEQTIEGAIALLQNSLEQQVCFVKQDISQPWTIPPIADGLVLHRVLSAIPDPSLRENLLAGTRAALATGGIISFLDFIVDWDDPQLVKQYSVAQRLIEQKILAYPSEILADDEIEVMFPILQKDGHAIDREKHWSAERLVKAIKNQELLIPFTAIHMTIKGYKRKLTEVGFQILEKELLFLPGLADQSVKRKVVRLTAQKV